MIQALLHVTMDPLAFLSEQEFHDWYNNEHGPARLRLPFITSGMRYSAHTRTTDSPSPPWLAIYDLKDMSWLDSPEYLRLRSPPFKSEREIKTMRRVTIVRRTFELVASYPNSHSMDSEDSALVEIFFGMQADSDIASVETEAAQIVTEARGESLWEQVRCFKSQHDLLALYKVSPGMLDDKKLHSAIQSTLSSFRQRNPSGSIKFRLWKPYYRFGPAPRHLSLEGNMWTHYGTRTIPAKSSPSDIAAVESFIELHDGLRIPYRLEGSLDPKAPVICLVNSVMVHWDIWKEFIEVFHARTKHTMNYRILRFASRGRFAPPQYPSKDWPEITVDLLVEDILGVLQALLIPQVECIIGVSLGGVTALRAGLLYPRIFPKFIACDTSVTSPAGNAKIWAERIAIADKEAASLITANGVEPIVGEELAEATLRRWTVPASWGSPILVERFQRIKAEVKMSSLDGFKRQVQALYDYDFSTKIRRSTAKGCFVVGAEDGKLPISMKKMAEQFGTGSTLHIVDGAGHLPMVEKPAEVCQILLDFLEKTS